MEVSGLDHWLGGIAERYPKLLVRLGNLESRWLEEEVRDRPLDRPVYVTGLARSGTTVLLEKLTGLPASGVTNIETFLLFSPLSPGTGSSTGPRTRP